MAISRSRREHRFRRRSRSRWICGRRREVQRHDRDVHRRVRDEDQHGGADGATTGPIAVTTPSGTAKSSDDFTIKHVRGISLSLSGHLVASGSVSVEDGTLACAATVPVRIQRRISDRWRVVGTTVTNGTGSYSLSLVDRNGRYRARAPRTPLSNGDVCVRAISSVIFNT
jgi:hypothetical protein